MGNIVLLDENTINKIAAGEVVDRPSSIVKELVENSVDANATNIVIEIKNGGISYIRITDNGDGFREDDTEIAFERHATSKIRKETDILKITSMGFRGEALASIAAISNIELVTKHKDELNGTKIVFSGGNMLLKEKVGANKGSVITIKDVFFNTPARFKFLKKDYTEAGYIEEAIIRIALANPSVAIKFINNGKIIVNTKGDNNLNNVIYSIFGKEVYENILSIDYVYENMRVTGVIGKPNISRSTRANEYTFINSRYVKDKILMSSIEKAFNEKLAINKFPFAIINLEMDTAGLDVNVHPAKLEVKFENESKVFNSVYFAIKDRLEKENRSTSPFSIISNINKESLESNTNIIQSNNEDSKSVNYSFENSITNENNITKNDMYNKESNIENTLVLEESSLGSLDISSYKVDDIVENNINDKVNSIDEKINNIQLETFSVKEQESFIPNINEKENIKSYKYIGILFNTYIVIEIEDKMYVIDQHAAHERLIYERFKKHYFSKNKETQMLIIPMIIQLKNLEKETVLNNIEHFEKCGYILEEFDNKSIKISGVPNIADIHLDDKEIFIDMIDELMGSSKTLRQDKEFRFLATVACKAAVKGNMFLNSKEHIALIDEMIALDNPFTCPHGRPTAYEISKAEIEKRVDRR